MTTTFEAVWIVLFAISDEEPIAALAVQLIRNVPQVRRHMQPADNLFTDHVLAEQLHDVIDFMRAEVVPGI